MRQRITNQHTLARLSARVGRPIKQALARGGTVHRVDIEDEQGVWWHVWPDGTVERGDSTPATDGK